MFRKVLVFLSVLLYSTPKISESNYTINKQILLVYVVHVTEANTLGNPVTWHTARDAPDCKHMTTMSLSILGHFPYSHMHKYRLCVWHAGSCGAALQEALTGYRACVTGADDWAMWSSVRGQKQPDSCVWRGRKVEQHLTITSIQESLVPQQNRIMDTKSHCSLLNCP